MFVKFFSGLGKFLISLIFEIKYQPVGVVLLVLGSLLLYYRQLSLGFCVLIPTLIFFVMPRIDFGEGKSYAFRNPGRTTVIERRPLIAVLILIALVVLSFVIQIGLTDISNSMWISFGLLFISYLVFGWGFENHLSTISFSLIVVLLTFIYVSAPNDLVDKPLEALYINSTFLLNLIGDVHIYPNQNMLELKLIRESPDPF